jgi:hypothetical protein
MRALNALRSKYEVVLFRGDIEEDEFLRAIAQRKFVLVLAPWYRYLAWSKVEGFYGVSRTSGPEFAGYYADTLMPYEVAEGTDYQRAILLDFAALETGEILRILESLIDETKRSGILPLSNEKAKVHNTAWYAGETVGFKIDEILRLPEMTQEPWADRTTAIRIAILSLWSLVFESRGKIEANIQPSKDPKAYFQFTADDKGLFLRLCYSARNRSSPKEMIKRFWPHQKDPYSPGQLLLNYTDFVRVHVIADTQDIEIVAALFPSAPSVRYPQGLHTLWIEPLSNTLVREIPSQTKSEGSGTLPHEVAGLSSAGESREGAKDRYILSAATKIRELKRELDEKNQMIRELRSGGIGTAAPIPTPEPETLLHNFQEKAAEMRLEIEKLEVQVEQASLINGQPSSFAT